MDRLNTMYYDSGSGNRLRLIEDRGDGKSLYEDLDAGGKVICSREAVDLYPRQTALFSPVSQLLTSRQLRA